MREGDIYRWKWADAERDTLGSFGDYHCKSRMAVFEKGRLTDTFWGSSPADGSYLSEDEVILTHLGNKNDLHELNDREDFYDPDDLIVMRHSNQPRAKTLIKSGVKRSPEFMRTALQLSLIHI